METMRTQDLWHEIVQRFLNVVRIKSAYDPTEREVEEHEQIKDELRGRLEDCVGAYKCGAWYYFQIVKRQYEGKLSRKELKEIESEIPELIEKYRFMAK